MAWSCYFPYLQVDILDGAAGRDTYGVLVLRSPSTPIEEKLPSTPAATTPTADVSVQTRPYHVHLSRLDAVKRKTQSTNVYDGALI